MKNGLYSVKFRVAGGFGGGVAVLRDGQFRGGDSGSYYVGTYQVDGHRVTADVQVRTHTKAPGMTFVLGEDGGDVHLEGSVTDTGANAKGTSAKAPGVIFECEFRWISD